MLLSPSEMMRKLARQFVSGDWFRLYGPHSPPAPAGSRLRIAIVSLIPYLGDAVMLFPLIDALRRENPDAEVSVFSTGAGRILALHPFVAHFFECNAGRSAWKPAAIARVVDLCNAWRKHYRGLRFDVCVVPRGGVEPHLSAHLAWMLGARVRMGYCPALEPELRHYDLGAASLFTTMVTAPNGIHEVERGSEILLKASLLKTPIDIRKPVSELQQIAGSSTAKAFLDRWPCLMEPYAIVAPGASVARRRWSPEAIAEIAQTEMIDHHILPVFVGSAVEQPLCESIARKLSGPRQILTGTSFEELAGLCARAEYFIGNDSGPAHVAGSLGVPTVVVTAYAKSGPVRHHASPARSHPCGPFVAVVQPQRQIEPCKVGCTAEFEHCITQVKTDDVRQTLDGLLADRMNSGRALPAIPLHG
jgi:ADP-heptose:LPS heptosyltransferase